MATREELIEAGFAPEELEAFEAPRQNVDFLEGGEVFSGEGKPPLYDIFEPGAKAVDFLFGEKAQHAFELGAKRSESILTLTQNLARKKAGLDPEIPLDFDPNDVDLNNSYHNILYQMGTFVKDVPFYIANMKMAGAALAPINLTGYGTALYAPLTIVAGFAMTEFMRSYYLEALRKGEVNNFGDFMARAGGMAMGTAKGAETGMLLAMSGIPANYALANASKLSTLASSTLLSSKLPLATGAFALQSAIEARKMPTWNDIQQTAAFLLTLEVGGKYSADMMKFAKTEGQKIIDQTELKRLTQRLAYVSEKTGIDPVQISSDMVQDRSLYREIVWGGKKSIPGVYAEQAQQHRLRVAKQGEDMLLNEGATTEQGARKEPIKVRIKQTGLSTTERKMMLETLTEKYGKSRAGELRKFKDSELKMLYDKFGKEKEPELFRIGVNEIDEKDVAKREAHRKAVGEAVRSSRLSQTFYDAVHAETYGKFGSITFKRNFFPDRLKDFEMTPEEFAQKNTIEGKPVEKEASVEQHRNIVAEALRTGGMTRSAYNESFAQVYGKTGTKKFKESFPDVSPSNLIQNDAHRTYIEIVRQAVEDSYYEPNAPRGGWEKIKEVNQDRTSEDWTGGADLRPDWMIAGGYGKKEVLAVIDKILNEGKDSRPLGERQADIWASVNAVAIEEMGRQKAYEVIKLNMEAQDFNNLAYENLEALMEEIQNANYELPKEIIAEALRQIKERDKNLIESESFAELERVGTFDGTNKAEVERRIREESDRLVKEYDGLILTPEELKAREAKEAELDKELYDKLAESGEVTPEAYERDLDYFIEQKLAEAELRRNAQLAADPGFVSFSFSDFKSGVSRIWKGLATPIADIWKNPGRFFKGMPTKFQNDCRIYLIAAVEKAKLSTNKTTEAIWGGLTVKDVADSVKLIWARDEYGRALYASTAPDMRLLEPLDVIEARVRDMEGTMSRAAINAADTWRVVMKTYEQMLISRGLMTPEMSIQDYAHHYTIDYTEEWMLKSVGIPTKLRNPKRGYLKEWKLNKREYLKTGDALVGHLLRVKYDNVIAEFISRECAQWDARKKLVRSDLENMLGVDRFGNTRKPIPGQVYHNPSTGEKYWGFCPDSPFTRSIYTVETEAGRKLTVLGAYKGTYLVPEQIYKAFNKFSEPGNKYLYYFNRAVGVFKSMAILKTFIAFTKNNFLGDALIASMSHPRPDDLLKSYGNVFRVLHNKGTGTWFDGFKAFLEKHDIQSSTFIAQETFALSKINNPMAKILNSAHKFSNYREAINRLAYASTMYDAFLRGDAQKMIDYHNWIDTKGLTKEEAMGKISRDVLVDYEWVSKGFKKWIRGAFFPFATWSFKMSPQIWRFTFKHPLRMMAAMASPYLLSGWWNYSNPRRRELEEQLPEDVRNQLHFTFENADPVTGNIRVLTIMQYPTDYLIGFKFIPIMTSYFARVATNEMTMENAVKKGLQEWGVKEAAGIAFLLNPLVRFGIGWLNEVDPYDHARIFSRPRAQLPPEQYAMELGMHLGKCLLPVLASGIKQFQGKMPMDVALRKSLDSFSWKTIVGLYDITPAARIQEGKRTITWDNKRLRSDIQNRTGVYINRLVNAFIDSGEKPRKFMRSNEARDVMLDVYEMWADKTNGKLRTDVSDDRKIRYVDRMIGQTIDRALYDDTNMAKWNQVKLFRASGFLGFFGAPDEVRKKIADEMRECREEALRKGIRTSSRASRELAELAEKATQEELDELNLVLPNDNDPELTGGQAQ